MIPQEIYGRNWVYREIIRITNYSMIMKIYLTKYNYIVYLRPAETITRNTIILVVPKIESFLIITKGKGEGEGNQSFRN